MRMSTCKKLCTKTAPWGKIYCTKYINNTYIHYIYIKRVLQFYSLITILLINTLSVKKFFTSFLQSFTNNYSTVIL